MLDKLDTQKITHAASLQGVTITDLRVEDGAIKFQTLAGKETTDVICKTLLNMGLQHIADDGEPEYFLDYTAGAQRVDVRWPYDPSRPLWSVA